MDLPNTHDDTSRYAQCVEVLKRVCWDIDRDVIRGRTFDAGRKYLPDALSNVDRLRFLSAAERRLLGQIQGRTYANMLGTIEHGIGTKRRELIGDRESDNAVALEALICCTDEEAKHRELFRCIEQLAAAGMPAGYRFVPDAHDFTRFVLGTSTWAVLALTYLVEILTQVHYREAIAPDGELSDLFKDVFFFHWKEESQHAIVDELEWRREHTKIGTLERDGAVDDLIALLAGIDRTVLVQAGADAGYFAHVCRRTLGHDERIEIERVIVGAYRAQYFASGLRERRFVELLDELVTREQGSRFKAALAPLLW